MQDPVPKQITLLLEAAANGDRGASEQVYDLMYDKLRVLAKKQLHRHGRATLDTTDLVHEAYMKLGAQGQRQYVDRGHFLSLAARVMRQILVDHAREKLSLKRGGGAHRKTLDDGHAVAAPQLERVIAVDQALARISRHDERLPSVVECKYFAGFTETETAAALGLSERTVRRLWQLARDELRAELAT